jgi:undecaprenyl pyrophosphate phosphatase UppP
VDKTCGFVVVGFIVFSVAGTIAGAWLLDFLERRKRKNRKL